MNWLLWQVVVSACVHIATASVLGHGLWAQLHSFNDLREWPQVLAKVARDATPLMLKLDPQWVPPSVCATQQRVRNATDPRGCLLLNHDSIVLSKAPYRHTFNTTFDLLDVLVEPSLAQYFALNAAPTVISLCFKGCGGLLCPCDAAIEPATAAWLSLVDEFVATASALIKRAGLNVEFVLDGNGNPGSAACLAQRWRPWVSGTCVPSVDGRARV
jgi:hypothetical protein